MAWSRALTRVLGSDDIDLDITSAAAGVTRHYDSAVKLNRDAIDARVWSGIHFRFADTAANTMGNHVGDARPLLRTAPLIRRIHDQERWTGVRRSCRQGACTHRKRSPMRRSSCGR
jgi:hypothetical protein